MGESIIEEVFVSETMRNYVRNYEDFENIADPELIQLAIDSDDGLAKHYLASNPNLSPDNVRELTNNSSDSLREVIASKNIPYDVLMNLINDEVEMVRAAALSNPSMSPTIFADKVLHGRFSLDSKRAFSRSTNSATNLEVFEFLWKNIKSGPQSLVITFDKAISDERLDIDDRIHNFIHREIVKGEVHKYTRTAYAKRWRVADPEILDQWKDDTYRSVIYGIAENQGAWVSTHEYLLDKYKSHGVRVRVAGATGNNELLNRIHAESRRTDLVWAVRNNPAFIPIE